MKSKLDRYKQFINEEVGIRNLKSIASRFNEMEIYFHKDLDGVCTALCVKEFFLRYYDIKTIDCHNIQYGGQEFAVKHPKEGILPVVCDFAHSKPCFTISLDHHQSQIGAGDTESTYYKPARSNVEIVSQEIAYSDMFTPQDIEMIQTIDSANFVKHNIKPEDVQNSIFSVNPELSGERNRFIMGFVVGRLLLAYKNKRITLKSLDGRFDHKNRNILECLVLDCSPSLYSMFVNIRHYIKNAKS